MILWIQIFALAPTFLGVEDLEDAMEVFVTAIMLAHQELD